MVISALIPLLLDVFLAKLDDAVLAGEDVVGVEPSRAHVEPLLLLPPPLLLHIIYTNRFKMKKLEIREESSQHQEAERESSEDSQQLRDQPTALEFVSKIKKKEAMFISYQGVFETATSSYPHSLALMYTSLAEEGWKVTHGQNTGISQHAGQGDRGFVWNMPFEMTYEVRKVQGWPQVAIVLYGKDYMGRSVARGYGNFHLPAGEGSHLRKVRIFQAVPPSTAATCCAYLMGYINELKTPEKVLLGTEGGREYLKTRPIGEVTVRVDVRRYNFDRYGYE